MPSSKERRKEQQRKRRASTGASNEAPEAPKTWSDGWESRKKPIPDTVSCYEIPGFTVAEVYKDYLNYHGGPIGGTAWEDTVCMYLTPDCMNPRHQREVGDPIIETVNRNRVKRVG